PPEVPRRLSPIERAVIAALVAFLIATLVATLVLQRSHRGGDLVSESSPRAGDPPATQAHTVAVTVLQLNDVYEMFPVDGRGGLARVATLRQQLEAENPNTLTVLAGDLVSPSALGQARVDGRPLAGRQMIDLMNRIGVKYAVFGNHEFDLKQD